jgi:hypothetical protein
MPGQVKRGFEPDTIMIPLKAMLPTKAMPRFVKRSSKYKRLSSSIAQVGVIEPLVVHWKPDNKGRYLLLDGHKKRMILLAQGQKEEVCLLSRDDEAFTYNKRVNHVSNMQEHLMIMRAVERGVPEARIAEVLNVKLEYIKRRKGLLRQICPEVVDALRDQEVNPVTFDVLRKMKPRRQIEACQLMKSAGNFSSAYGKALLAASRDSDLAKTLERKPAGPTTCADLALMERELKTVQNDFTAIESSYGENVLHLVIGTRYLSRLIGNRRIARYLDENHPEILKGFGAIVSAASLEDVAEPANQ